MQAQVSAQFTGLGTNLLVVRPAARGTGGVNTGTQQNLNVDDAFALSRLDGVESVWSSA